MMIHKLPCELLCKIASFIPFSDGLHDSNANSTPTIIGFATSFECQTATNIMCSYFDYNVELLKEILNSNESSVTSLLQAWFTNQRSMLHSVRSLISQSSDYQSNTENVMLRRHTISFYIEESVRVRCCRSMLQIIVESSIDEITTTNGFSAFRISPSNFRPRKRKKNTYSYFIRAIDNELVYGMSYSDVVRKCLDAYDRGCEGVNLFYTTELLRERCVDPCISSPALAAMICVDQVVLAWLSSQRMNETTYWKQPFYTYANTRKMERENGGAKPLSFFVLMNKSSSHDIISSVIDQTYISPLLCYQKDVCRCRRCRECVIAVQSGISDMVTYENTNLLKDLSENDDPFFSQVLRMVLNSTTVTRYELNQLLKEATRSIVRFVSDLDERWDETAIKERIMTFIQNEADPFSIGTERQLWESFSLYNVSEEIETAYDILDDCIENNNIISSDVRYALIDVRESIFLRARVLDRQSKITDYYR